MVKAVQNIRDAHVAVIGSGVSGLATAYLLQRHGAKVTLFEAASNCGGHTLTDNSSGWPVDLGFQVYNLSTYPHLVSWFELLGVRTEPSNMSFSVSVDSGAMEWASHSLASVFAQRVNIFSAKFLRMLWDVWRFGRDAPHVLEPENEEQYHQVSLGEYLRSNRHDHWSFVPGTL
jgi:predicted NAD/FAD-binding protein